MAAPRVVGAARGLLDLVTGVTIVVQDGTDEVGETDVVFIPNVIVSSGATPRYLDRRVLGWIRTPYAAGAHLYASCGGPLALAKIGLLDGMAATPPIGAMPSHSTTNTRRLRCIRTASSCSRRKASGS